MLRELFVQNLALIEDVRVELEEGFCAWTGETGAGKTLLLEALGLLLGQRGSADLLRSGTEELRITGRFELSQPELRRKVEQLLQAPMDSELILTRRLTQSGRSYAYVNDQPIAINTLRELGNMLVDIHGQHESQSLLEPAYQLELLDAYGQLQDQRKTYLETAEKVREFRRRHDSLSAARQHRLRELALLQFEREELDKAELITGELAELTRERERLTHTQAIQSFAAEGCARLYDEEGSVVEQLGKLQREVQPWVALDPGLADIAHRLDGLASDVQDVAETLRHLGQRWEADPERLEEVDNRLHLLRRLEAKYHKSIEELIDYRASLEDQEARLKKEEEDLTSIQDEVVRSFARLRTAAAELSKQRQKVARRLATETQRQFADLGMADARLEAVLEQFPLGEDPLTAEVPAWGVDHLELTLAANPGEPARPLRKVASGGELSRTMLALKTVLSAHDLRAILVFDEIDANVGGRLGDVLGQKLSALGQTHQVICVTHLPQVASYARNHWTIRKVRQGKRTTTTVQLLGEEERLEELASMLRGESRGETTRQEAAAMLAAARRRTR